MSLQLTETLKNLKKQREDVNYKIHDWVFINPHNHSERAKSFNKSFREARNRAGLPQLNRYTLRHFFCSMAIEALANEKEFDLFTVARWLGHADLKMIMSTYAHLLPDHSKKQMAKLRL